jgi:hypothetical protein
MSQYITGSVDVTNASNVVSGNGTLWNTNNAVQAGDVFMVDGVYTDYEIASVDSDTQITLTANWAGSTLTYQSYQITRNFTPNYNFREIHKGDREWPFHYTEALRDIDTQMKTLSDRIETKATTTSSSSTTSTTA